MANTQPLLLPAPLPPAGSPGLPRTLFVKGLAKGASERHLHAIFASFGSVIDCQIARHRSGRSAGFAIVTFIRHEEAAVAMQHVDNEVFLGRRLSCKWFEAARVLGGDGGGQQAPLMAFQNLGAADLLALAQLLEANTAIQQANTAIQQEPPALQAVPQQQPWSMVSSWLNEYVGQPQDGVLQQQQQPVGPADAIPPEVPATCVVTASRLRSNLEATAAAAAATKLTAYPTAFDSLDLSRLSLRTDGISPLAPSQLAASGPNTPSCVGTADASAVVTPAATQKEQGVACSTAPASVADDASSETASTHTGCNASDAGLDGAAAAAAAAQAGHDHAAGPAQHAPAGAAGHAHPHPGMLQQAREQHQGRKVADQRAAAATTMQLRALAAASAGGMTPALHPMAPGRPPGLPLGVGMAKRYGGMNPAMFQALQMQAAVQQQQAQQQAQYADYLAKMALQNQHQHQQQMMAAAAAMNQGGLAGLQGLQGAGMPLLQGMPFGMPTGNGGPDINTLMMMNAVGGLQARPAMF